MDDIINKYITEKWVKTKKLPIEIEALLRNHKYNTNVDGNNISVEFSKNSKSIKITIDNPKTIEKAKTFVFNLIGMEQEERRRLSKSERE